MSEKMFPLQAGYSRDARPGPLLIPWSVAEKAYGVYAARYGRSQTLERLAERGGFGTGEMDDLYPNWRVEVDEITKLKEQVAKLQAFKDWVHNYLDTHGVPHHPPGVHGAEGCRIGDRMDWLMARVAELKAALRECDRLTILGSGSRDLAVGRVVAAALQEKPQ